jgi:hypothetical protein
MDKHDCSYLCEDYINYSLNKRNQSVICCFRDCYKDNGICPYLPDVTLSFLNLTAKEIIENRQNGQNDVA